MAVHDQWLRASQQRLAFSKTLWQDVSLNYGDVTHAHYWRQRPQRMAYQYAIVDHLLSAAKNLAQAILKQLASTRFDDVLQLSWAEIEVLLLNQKILSAEAQQLLMLVQEGDWMHLIQLQQQTDFSVITKPQDSSGQLISARAEDDLTNPDHWPVARWIENMQNLQASVRDSMGEW
ncbi:MAG: hypothetical protein PSN46_04140 [Gammaproteobacteria bacterium]|nr:hypothetical protein [Gammaproteobacteria bacterium]